MKNKSSALKYLIIFLFLFLIGCTHQVESIKDNGIDCDKLCYEYHKLHNDTCLCFGGAEGGIDEEIKR